jgi:hypothetical protein
MAVGFSTCITKRPMYPAFTFFSSSSDTFQSYSFDFFDEFDYGAIGYAIFLQKRSILKHIYLPLWYLHRTSSRALLVSSCLSSC